MFLFLTLLLGAAGALWFYHREIRKYLERQFEVLFRLFVTRLKNEMSITQDFRDIMNNLPKQTKETKVSTLETNIKQYEEANNVRLLNIVDNKNSENNSWSSLLSTFGDGNNTAVSLETTQTFMEAFRKMPEHKPVTIIVNTSGGPLTNTQLICNTLLNHKGPITVVIPQYAFSAGTIFAVCATKVIMDPNAMMSPIDPQIGSVAASAILKGITASKDTALAGPFKVWGDAASKSNKMMTALLAKINVVRKEKDLPEFSESLIKVLSSGEDHSHNRYFNITEIKELGLDVEVGVSDELYKLFQEIRDEEPKWAKSSFGL